MLRRSSHIKKGLSKEVTSEPPPEEHWKQVQENNSTIPEQENVALEREECRGQWGSLPPPGFWVERQTSPRLENCPGSPLICQWG